MVSPSLKIYTNFSVEHLQETLHNTKSHPTVCPPSLSLSVSVQESDSVLHISDMLGKRPPPLIGKLSEMLVSGGWAGAPDTSTSPRSPLDFKALPSPSPSPRGLKGYDLGGVGLGIVAALEKSGHEGAPAKYCICSPRLSRPPAPVVSGAGVKMGTEEWETESEIYTYVTCHGPNKSFTKVYYDGCEYGNCNTGHEIRCSSYYGGLRESRRKIGEEDGRVDQFKALDFLSACHLCGKKLHGKDIYMYRGEKAFCSTECRSSQIMSDERKEQCRAEASSSRSRTAMVDVSSSPYNTNGNIFSAGILAI